MRCPGKPAPSRGASPAAGQWAAALDRAETRLARLAQRPWPRDRVLLPLFLAAGAAASVALGTDRNWDLLNYHLYNPLALLTDRGGDIAPPGAQAFFNPAPDLPFFWLLRTLNGHPAAVAALMGLPAGAAAFLVLLLSRAVLRDAGVGPLAPLLAGLATIGAATGATFRSQIGTTHNDLLTAVPLLAALLLALRAAAALPPRTPPAGTLLLAGALAGAAVGLKLTNAPFAVALGGALAAALRAGGRPMARPLGLLLGGGALGFALAGGPWMLRLWQEWGNPFFPFFDAFFAAGRRPPAPIERDPRFLPQGALEWLFFPFTWALSDAPRSSEMEMRDPRMALAFLAFPALAIGTRRCLARPAVAFLAAFLALSYLLWLAVFSIYRYVAIVEALSLLLALVAVAAFAPRRRIGLLALLLVAGSAAATDPPSWGRAPLGPRYLDAALPDLPAGALLLLRREEPLAYLAAVAPAGARFAGMSAVAQFGPASPFADRLRRALDSAPPTYVLAPELEGAADTAAALGLRLDAHPCRRVCTNWTSGGLGPLVCPAAKAEDGGGLPPAPAYAAPHSNMLCGIAGAGLTLGGRRGPRLHPQGALLWPPEGCRRLRLATEPGAAPRLLADAAIERSGENDVVVALAPDAAGPLSLRSGAGSFHLQAAECLD